LAELKKQRDRYAHTYTRSGKKIIDNSTYLGFSEIEKRASYINKGLRIIQGFVFRRF